MNHEQFGIIGHYLQTILTATETCHQALAATVQQAAVVQPVVQPVAQLGAQLGAVTQPVAVVSAPAATGDQIMALVGPMANDEIARPLVQQQLAEMLGAGAVLENVRADQYDELYRRLLQVQQHVANVRAASAQSQGLGGLGGLGGGLGSPQPVATIPLV